MKNYFFMAIASVIAFSAHASSESSYAGQEVREIKALSRQQIQDHLDGKGLGYAKAAELNHYPGPRHVLDLSGELGLTKEQIIRTQEIFDDMKREASLLGNRLVEKERELDRIFATGSADRKSVERLVSEIGALQAGIRYVHLSAHIQQKKLLNEHQIWQYDRLRGYGASHHKGHNHLH